MDELKQTMLARASIYEFLFSVFYKSLTTEQLKHINTFIDVIDSLNINAKLQLDEIREIIKIDDLEMTLNAGFTMLYGTGVNVPITEHNYLKDTPKTDVVLSLSNMFADNNVAKPTAVNHSIDSFAVELYFMFKTSASDADVAKTLVAQQTFLEQHLLKWCNLFSDDTNNKAQSQGERFYACMALVCCEYLKYDKELIAELLNDFK